MPKKLTKPERLVNEQMLALLEWASDHPKHWHDIGPEAWEQARGGAAREARGDRGAAAAESVQVEGEVSVNIEVKLGCYCEDYPWQILENEEFERNADSLGTTCKHAIVISENIPKFRNDGSIYGHYTTHRVPRIVRAFNEAAHNSTAVCLDCILEAAATSPTS